MEKKSEYRGGSELHRLRPMKEGYDKKLLISFINYVNLS